MQEARQIGAMGRRTFLSQMAMGTGLALGHWGCQPTPQMTNIRIGINDWCYWYALNFIGYRSTG